MPMRIVFTTLISAAIAARDLAPLTKAVDSDGVCSERTRTLKRSAKMEDDPRYIADNPTVR